MQALARLPLNVRRADRARGLDTAAFISGYEGSPLGGYDLELQRNQRVLDECDVVFRPGVNEELAATSVQGTQLAPSLADARVDGVTGYWYGKSPGLDRAADALRHANLMGTHPRGGAVALVGDDPSAKSSTLPGASEILLSDLGMPILYPADPQDVLDLGTHAVAMSRCSRPVGRTEDRHECRRRDRQGPGRPRSRHARACPNARFEHHVNTRLLQPHLSEMERTREGIRLDTARAYARANRLNKVESFGTIPKLGLIAAGQTYLDLRQALRILGLDEAGLQAAGVRLLRLAMIHPLIPAEIAGFADGLDEIIVVEEKRGFVESAVRADPLRHPVRAACHRQDDTRGHRAVRRRWRARRRFHRRRAGPQARRPARMRAGGRLAGGPGHCAHASAAAARHPHAVLLLWLPAQHID